MEWTVHPIRRHHGRTVLLVLILAVTLGGLWVETREPLWVVFAAAILMIAVRQYLLPTTYILDADGARSVFCGVSRKKDWSQIRSHYRDKNGVLLSTFPARSRMETFRGLYLIFDANGDEVMRVVRERTEKARSDG